MNQLAAALLRLIGQIRKDNGYAMILDVSSPQTPVMFASNSVDVTRDIIELTTRALQRRHLVPVRLRPALSLPQPRSGGPRSQRPRSPKPAPPK